MRFNNHILYPFSHFNTDHYVTLLVIEFIKQREEEKKNSSNLFSLCYAVVELCWYF